MHGPNGQFVKGNQAYKLVTKARGPKKADLQALRDSLPPERLVQELERLHAEAMDRGWLRLALEILRMWAAYSIGKPAEKVEVTTDSAAVLSQWLAGRQPMQPGDVTIIDVDPVDSDED